MWWLALKSLIADRGRLLTSVLGVAFSVALVNIQASLLLGLIKKASLLVDFGQADIWVGHKHMQNVDIGTFVPERWVYRLRSIEGVDEAQPYVVMFSQAILRDGRYENVIVVGSDPRSLLGNAWSMGEGDSRAIRHPEGVLVDECDLPKLGYCKIGQTLEINGQRAKVVGYTKGIVGFTTNPYVFTTLERARRKYTAGIPPEHVSYFLVKAKPGTDVGELCEKIRQRVPELDVYDRNSYGLMCMDFWLTRTGIGISFGLAALLGLFVGLGVVAQTLYASVAEHVKEFGTLKAMGADDFCIGRFLLAQAVANAVAGSLLGLASAFVLSLFLSSPRAPVLWNEWVVAASVALVSGVCLVAVWLPYQRVRQIDPVDVLRN